MRAEHIECLALGLGNLGFPRLEALPQDDAKAIPGAASSQGIRRECLAKNELQHAGTPARHYPALRR